MGRQRHDFAPGHISGELVCLCKELTKKLVINVLGMAVMAMEGLNILLRSCKIKSLTDGRYKTVSL